SRHGSRRRNPRLLWLLSAPQRWNSTRGEAFGHARQTDRTARQRDVGRMPPGNRPPAPDPHPYVRTRPSLGRRARVYPRLRRSKDRIDASDAPRAHSRIRAPPNWPAHVFRARSARRLPGDDRIASSAVPGVDWSPTEADPTMIKTETRERIATIELARPDKK